MTHNIDENFKLSSLNKIVVSTIQCIFCHKLRSLFFVHYCIDGHAKPQKREGDDTFLKKGDIKKGGQGLERGK